MWVFITYKDWCMTNVDINNCVCPLCRRTIDLDHAMVELRGRYYHNGCVVNLKYTGLVDICASLINDIEEGEEIDLDELREDLIHALDGL